jgi:hypothetical protein
LIDNLWASHPKSSLAVENTIGLALAHWSGFEVWTQDLWVLNKDHTIELKIPLQAKKTQIITSPKAGENLQRPKKKTKHQEVGGGVKAKSPQNTKEGILAKNQ